MINLTKTDREVLIDLIDEVLTENFIDESNLGPEVANEKYNALLEKIRVKLENN